MTLARAMTWSLVLLLLGRSAVAQTADHVLLVVNEKSEASVRVGDHYARRRGVSADHIVRIATVTSETISRDDFERQIESPIATWLAERAFQDQILYIVVTKGVPLRISGSEGLTGTTASVDSELTLLYRKMVGLRPTLVGQVANPYYLDQSDISTAKRFSRAGQDIYLVARLDGYTVEDAIKLIDRAQTAKPDGQVVLDLKATGSDAGGDRWLGETAARLRRTGFAPRVVLESTKALATTAEPVLGYYSWGSNDPANHLRQFGLRFTDGALGGMFLSTDGRSFNEPPADWLPGGRSIRGSGTQSLIGDLIREGITGVAGHVSEPYLNATIRPQVLFPAYFAGFSLVESFYLAMPFLSWQTIIVGDPLVAPFPGLARIESTLVTIDPRTLLPTLFSERRLQTLTRAGLNRDAVGLFLRAEVEGRRKNPAEAEALMVKAADLEPRLTDVNLQLAAMYQARGEHDRAIDRYRRVIAAEPTHFMALNNLAYALAHDKQQPKDALAFAVRAYEISQEPLVADTLGWIHHLLGDDASAAPLIERAVAGARTNVDVLIHAAIVHANLGDPRALQELEAAEKLDPDIAQRPDVRALKGRLRPD